MWAALRTFLPIGGPAVLKGIIRATVALLGRPTNAGDKAADAKPCCQEAASRLYGRCEDGSCCDSQMQVFMEDWAEQSRLARGGDLKSLRGDH